MKRTTISLPDELAVTLDHEARRRGVSISEVARSAIAQHFEVDAEEPRSVPFAGVVELEKMPQGFDIDIALGERWAADIERDR